VKQAWLFVALCCAIGAAGRQAPQQPNTFTSRVTLVPVDVRVLDSRGQPITNLSRDDFTVLENGVPQHISHFDVQKLTARDALAPAPAFVGEVPSTTPQTSRVFLFLFGRGRHSGPSHDLDAAIDFVRKRLLPQDYAAVLAYNRATEFTTDHERVAHVLTRFRDQHEWIEAQLASRESPLALLYGSRSIPPHVQTRIDDTFRGPGGSATRTLQPVTPSDSERLAVDDRRTTDALQEAEIAKAREGRGMDSADTTPAVQRLSLDEYVAQNAQTMQALENLYAGIQYLRRLEGEKHLVLVTREGLFLPRSEDDDLIAAAANDARVVIDTLHTSPSMPPTGWADQTSQRLSALTGGLSSIVRTGTSAFRRIDEITRASYQIGYYPANPAMDGRYRRITVTVKRPGATVLYRHGYVARRTPPAVDRRTFVTYSRIAAAGGYGGELHDLRLRMNAPVVVGPPGAQAVQLNAFIDTSTIAFKMADGKHVAALDVAVYCGGEREKLIGERWQTITIALTDANFARAQQIGIPFNTSVPVKGRVRFVKLIVYDYDGDKLGTAVAAIK
jgi:VWFA-related protein